MRNGEWVLLEVEVEEGRRRVGVEWCRRRKEWAAMRVKAAGARARALRLLLLGSVSCRSPAHLPTCLTLMNVPLLLATPSRLI